MDGLEQSIPVLSVWSERTPAQVSRPREGSIMVVDGLEVVKAMRVGKTSQARPNLTPEVQHRKSKGSSISVEVVFYGAYAVHEMELETRLDERKSSSYN